MHSIEVVKLQEVPQALATPAGLYTTSPAREIVMPSQYTPAFLARFWAKVDQASECWVWIGPKTGNGYGAIREDAPSRRQVAAHRASWEIHFGVIGAGLEVCHRCDNPVCVRPDHLFLGTTRDNAADRSAKGRSGAGDRSGRRLHPDRYPNGSAVPGAKLTDEAVREIRRRYDAGAAGLTVLGRQFGVTKQTIQRIVRRQGWTHVQ